MAQDFWGQALWRRAVHISSHGAHLSLVPSGDRPVNPATSGASGHSGLQQSLLSASAQKRSGSAGLATSKEVSRAARSASPAGPPLQDTKLAALSIPKVSLERLISLVHYLAVWKRLPNVSQWVLRTVERGYRIQFKSRQSRFSRVFPTLVGPEQALVFEQEVDTLLRKEAIEVVPPLDRESGFHSQYFIVSKAG